MPTQARRNIPRIQLVEILFALSIAANRWFLICQQRIKESLGIPEEPIQAGTEQYRQLIYRRMASLIAYRLLRDRRERPLQTAADITKVTLPVRKNLLREVPLANRAMTNSFLLQVCHMVTVHNTAALMLGDTPYDYLWKTISGVMKIAAEHHLSPADLLATAHGYDAAIVSYYTRERFIEAFGMAQQKELTENVTQLFTNVISMDPGSKDDPDALRESQELLRECMAESLAVYGKWLQEEADRIFGSASSQSAALN